MTIQPTEIARKFVDARTTARALPDYPGAQPNDLDEGYQVQELAIGLWPDEIAGWKIGRVPPDWTARLGAERLAGPIFSRLVWPVQGKTPIPFPVFNGGFAAVEAEFVLRMAEDAPPSKTDWTESEAVALVAGLHIGVELAGSPLATINALGSPVVASDFGNNHGLIVGAEIPNWSRYADEDLICETFIEGQSVGRGTAAGVLGGPIGSLVFLLEHLARRGRPLKAGQYVSTGAATGVHDVKIGESARVSFGPLGEILCFAQAAMPAQIRRAAKT
ncbi:MAG: 2-keto-4-pentenoate hydratase [Terricaulis silvestris]